MAAEICKNAATTPNTTLATIAANIEVLIVVDAFGMEMTLGNVLTYSHLPQQAMRGGGKK